MKDRIIEIMAEVLKINICGINETTVQTDVLNWDSLAHLNLMLKFEDEFNISLEPEDIGRMTSFKMIYEILQSYIDKKAN
jgi:acyl carrier protein